MKTIRILAPTLVALFLLPLVVLGSDRIVLLESFTNVSCPPCATANPVTAQFVQDYGTTEPISIINVQYHMYWPSPTDPFYVSAMEENNAARTYYGISAVPDLITDGENTPNPGDYNGLESAMEDRLAIPSPFLLEVSTEITGCDITVNASVTATDVVPASGLVLRMALVDEYVAFDSPPGSNGETEFNCTMRDMLPSFNGTPLAITNGQTLVFSETAAIDPDWNNIYAVVWVQDNTTKEVMQAARTWPDPNFWTDYSLAYKGTKLADLTEVGMTASLTSEATNNGTLDDTYDIHMDNSGLPRDWIASICVGGTCYPPFITDLSIPVNAGMMEEITVDITPIGGGGEGSVTLTVTGQGNPCVSVGELTFKVITLGASVLLIDDDGGSSYEGYFESSVAAAGKTYTTWDHAWGDLAADKMGAFDAVVWFTGTRYDCLGDSERASLAAFLDDGGRLFMTGQDIGYSIFDYQSSAAGITWYNTYLGANYLSDEVSFREVEGIAGDPVSDGWFLTIEGGDGANNQGYPSKVEAFGDGQLCVQYNQQAAAGTHTAAGAYKTVYFAFGFEAISTQADRDMVMDGVLTWLTAGASDVPQNDLGKAYLASLPKPSPNPFNPCTQIKFDLGGSLPAQVKIDVYDVRGFLVRSLHDGLVMPGPQSFTWDGRSNLGAEVASGAYMGVIRVGDETEKVKMLLAK